MTLWLVALAILLGSSCRKPDGPAPATGPGNPSPATPQVTTTPGGFEMVLIPAGSFRMGSRNGESDETPVHQLRIDAFLMDRYEMTQAQCVRLARGTPYLSGTSSHFKGPDRPAEMVSWSEAALYCNQRSHDEGLEPCYDEATAECDFEADGYRLPTEAEWEYACRAGTGTDYHFGSDPRLLKRHAWCAENSGKQTHPVGRKKPNAWGLFDMHGNVAEWCNDVYLESYYHQSPAENPRGPAGGEKYVLRGGAWNCRAKACRSARRVGEDPGFQDACFARDAIGFRCVRRAAAGAEPDASLPDEEAADPEQHVSTPEEQPVSSQEKAAGDQPPRRTGFVYGEIYLEHKTGPDHPEAPERLTSIVRRLEKTGLLERLVRIPPVAADTKWLTEVHTPQYVARVRRSCEEGQGWVDTPDAPASKESYRVALAAAGGVLEAIDAVMEGKVRNAFCAVRPPGHHALEDEAMGFCLFNNVAIAARYVQKKHRLAKVLIVDWDVHHGNGTQAIFYDDPTVLYFGVHQSPFYPGTGAADEKGEGPGLGYTVNVPLPAGSGDAVFKRAFDEKLRPAAREFKPDFVLVSSGFDAHEDDLLGRMLVTSEGFAELTRIVREIADKNCRGRLVSMLEGGYGPTGPAAGAEAHLRALMD